MGGRQGGGDLIPTVVVLRVAVQQETGLAAAALEVRDPEAVDDEVAPPARVGGRAVHRPGG
jgi:hypothetical protein